MNSINSDIAHGAAAPAAATKETSVTEPNDRNGVIPAATVPLTTDFIVLLKNLSQAARNSCLTVSRSFQISVSINSCKSRSKSFAGGNDLIWVANRRTE